MSDTVAVLIAIVGIVVGSGGVASVVRVRSEIRRLDAEVGLSDAEKESILVEASEKAVGVVKLALAHLEGDLDKARRQLAEVRVELEKQRRQRHELENLLDTERIRRAELEARVGALEDWIRLNTSANPEEIP
jgi:chromosome segregation ATPase